MGEGSTVHVVTVTGENWNDVIAVFSDLAVAEKLMDRMSAATNDMIGIQSFVVDGYTGPLEGPVAYYARLVKSQHWTPYWTTSADLDMTNLPSEDVEYSDGNGEDSWGVWTWAEDREDAKKKTVELFKQSPYAERIAECLNELEDHEKIVASFEIRDTPFLNAINIQGSVIPEGGSATLEWGMAVNDDREQDDVHF